jgi:hypothetical protein
MAPQLAHQQSSFAIISSATNAPRELEVANCDFKLGRDPSRPYLRLHGTGVAMLSSALRSPLAVEVNIAIMRTFVQLRRLMDSHRDLARKIEAMEKRYDQQFAVVFDAIKQLIAQDSDYKAKPKRRIGFNQ